MTASLGGAVELLERSLAYTRSTLTGIRPDILQRPTPCDGWVLHRLLTHMEDALDAFIQASSGEVDVAPVPACTGQVEALREKACALLGAWLSAELDTGAAAPGSGSGWTVRVGDRGVNAPLLVATAALEVTVHGWDVGQATGASPAVPEALARDLLPVARSVIPLADRGDRFAAPRPPRPGAAYGERLLAWTGRAA